MAGGEKRRRARQAPRVEGPGAIGTSKGRRGHRAAESPVGGMLPGAACARASSKAGYIWSSRCIRRRPSLANPRRPPREEAMWAPRAYAIGMAPLRRGMWTRVAASAGLQIVVGTMPSGRARSSSARSASGRSVTTSWLQGEDSRRTWRTRSSTPVPCAVATVPTLKVVVTQSRVRKGVWRRWW